MCFFSSVSEARSHWPSAIFWRLSKWRWPSSAGGVSPVVNLLVSEFIFSEHFEDVLEKDFAMTTGQTPSPPAAAADVIWSKDSEQQVLNGLCGETVFSSVIFFRSRMFCLFSALMNMWWSAASHNILHIQDRMLWQPSQVWVSVLKPFPLPWGVLSFRACSKLSLKVRVMTLVSYETGRPSHQPCPASLAERGLLTLQNQANFWGRKNWQGHFHREVSGVT